MLQRYSFLKHPFYFVLEHAKQMVDGLGKCTAIFNNNGNTEVLEYINQLKNITNTTPESINELRKIKRKTNWIQPNQLYFELFNKSPDQLSFSDEEDSSVLELRFINPIDKLYDILYFYINPNATNFKLVNSNNKMEVTYKETVQKLLHNFINLTLKNHYSNALIHKKISNTIDIKPIKKEISGLKELNFKQTKEYYTYILNEITNSEATDFTLSDDAVNKLKQQNTTLKEVENILKNSLEIIINKYELSSLYEINDYDIILPKNTTPTETIKQQSLNKTIVFLDKYEHSAKLLLTNNEKVTGVNIGNRCEPNISAAAISDILRKHQQNIIKLFNQYPDKWTTIRTHFTPLKTIEHKTYLKQPFNKSA